MKSTVNKLCISAAPRILIFGDVMLDRFEYGKVRRISPEAPVPILLHTNEKTMLGGAGNVAVNVRALDAEASLFAAIGPDADGERVNQLLKESHVGAQLFLTKKAPTIVKTRFIAGTNHILRVDREADPHEEYEPSAKDMPSFKKSICDAVSRADIVLISDYGKGFASHAICRTVFAAAKRYGKRVLVDPKGTDYAKYAGASLVKPNLKEFSEVSGLSFNPKDGDFIASATAAGRELCKKRNIDGLLVTLSEHGMLFISADKKRKSIHLPTEAREVFDVSGAGDTTLAALAVALAEGQDTELAMRFANAAAGVVVAKLGTATATREEIARASSNRPANLSPAAKILPLGDLNCEIERLRCEGKLIGFTNGCFDCCHLGHLSSLQEARRLCDVLVVGVNSDEWIRKHKGPDRPIQDEATRTALLAALECVNYVTVFSEKTALPLVKAIRPDVIAKEGYSIDQWPEGQYVNAHGGKAVVIKRIDGYSTTALVDRMKKRQ